MTENTTPTPVSDDPSVAFEELRREVAFGRAAIEGLTAARQRMPDYSPTLSEMSGALREIRKRVGNIEGSPAMGLTPSMLAVEIAQAGESARATDQRLLHEARNGILRSIGQLTTIIEHGRSAEGQRRALALAAVGSFLIGVLLMTVVPGAIARSLPESWHVPEWMAARTIGADKQEAGMRILRAARAESATGRR